MRVNVGEVHRQRVVDQLADFEGGRRRDGREEHVARLEGPVEIVADEPADFEGLEIIGVVVAGREGVVAQHDAAFDFVAEAFAARGGVHVDQAVELLGPVAVMDAVVAGQVAGRLGRGDQVVRGDRVFRVGQRHVDERRAQRSIQVGRRPARPPSTSGSRPAAKYSVGRPIRRPATAAARATGCSRDTGQSTEVESRGSCPAMTSRSMAAPATSLAKGPN